MAKSITLLLLLACVSAAPRAAGSGYFEVLPLEMDEVSMFRFGLVGYSDRHFEGRLRISTPWISFAFDGNSPFSETAFSPSLSFLYFPSFYARMAAESDGAWYWVWFPLTLLQSSYHYAPGGWDNLMRTEDTGLTGSLFLKNNVDPFLFNSRKWIKVTPGAGAGLVIVKYGAVPVAFDLAVGYVHSFANDFRGHWVGDPGVYAKFSFSGD